MNRKHKDITVIFQDINEMETYIKNAGSTGGILKILRKLPGDSVIIKNLCKLTDFLNRYDADINTRVYYINHNLTTPILCNNCGSLLKVNVLRRLNELNFCNNECLKEYRNKQKKYKKDNERLKFNNTDELIAYIQSLQCTGSFYKMISTNKIYADICQLIYNATEFLNDCNDSLDVLNLQYRIYYIYHNITKPVLCNKCHTLMPLSIIRQGGKYCSKSCYNQIAKSEETKARTSTSVKKAWSLISEEDKVNIYKKVAENNIKKYGNKCTLNLPENIKKKTRTWINKYGYDNPNKAIEVKQKTVATNIKKYGVVSPSLLTNVYERWKKFHNYNMPDGRVFKIQGWEEQALDLYLLKTYSSADIEHDIHYMHNFKFMYYH